MATYLYLQDSGSVVWQVAVDNSGILSTSQVAGTVVPIIFKDTNLSGRFWQLGVDTSGVLTTTSVGSDPAAAYTFTMQDPSNVTWYLSADSYGVLHTSTSPFLIPSAAAVYPI